MYTFEPHTSEVTVRLEAPTLRGLFEQAGRSLAEIVAGGPVPEPDLEYETVSLSAPDRDALLVDWLNELIYLTERDERVFSAFTIERLTDRELVAGVRGAPLPELRTLVKAATFQGLRIEETPAGFTARVVLDV